MAATLDFRWIAGSGGPVARTGRIHLQRSVSDLTGQRFPHTHRRTGSPVTRQLRQPRHPLRWRTPWKPFQVVSISGLTWFLLKLMIISGVIGTCVLTCVIVYSFRRIDFGIFFYRFDDSEERAWGTSVLPLAKDDCPAVEGRRRTRLSPIRAYPSSSDRDSDDPGVRREHGGHRHRRTASLDNIIDVMAEWVDLTAGPDSSMPASENRGCSQDSSDIR